MLLTLDSIVKVDVAIAAVGNVASHRFDVGVIVITTASVETGGPSATVRAVHYDDLTGVAAHFADSTDTYKEAAEYFGANPTPRGLWIAYAGSGETPAQVLGALLDISSDWYGVYWHGADATTIGNIDTYLNSINMGMLFYPVTGTPVTIVAAAPLSTLYAAKSPRAVAIYTATGKECCAVMGTAMGCSNTMSDRTWQMCYRSITGMAPNTTLTQENINTLMGVNANVYVTRATNMNLFERGATASGLRIDEVINIDRIAADIRDALVEVMINNKLPQNDSTTTQFMSAITEVLETFVGYGVIGAGVWSGEPIGETATGDMLDRGYALYADSFDLQTPENRAARKGMPITVGLILSGSVESVEISITVQQ